MAKDIPEELLYLLNHMGLHIKDLLSWVNQKGRWKPMQGEVVEELAVAILEAQEGEGEDMEVKVNVLPQTHIMVEIILVG
jgi:hypothetical protein